MKSYRNLAFFSLVAAAISVPAVLVAANEVAVKITPDLASVDVLHNGKKITIRRNQDQNHTIDPAFARTSRKCPPFCIQPSILAPGVKTIGELEVIEYLRKIAGGDESVLVIDSRTPDWVKQGTIPGSVNIPWTSLNPAWGADPISIGDILTGRFNVEEQEGLWNFSAAKTLVLFCNGMWCGQSPNNIANLLRFGYPAEKLKWYRGGMQDWKILGLTTVPGE